jgi:hypothetical protein
VVQKQLQKNVDVLTVSIVDFAMTEAAYTVVRLLQRFSVLEKPNDEVEERTGREQQTMTLVSQTSSSSSTGRKVRQPLATARRASNPRATGL